MSKDHTAEATVVWETTKNPTKEANVVHFPTVEQEATYQEISVGPNTRLTIVSSGFGKQNKAATRMQLVA